MGLVVALVLVVVTAAALWPLLRLQRGALQLLGAALLMALAGYVWQGRPALPGQPKPPAERLRLPESAFAELRGDVLGRFDRASAWLTIAESYQRRGDTRGAVGILRSGIRQSPRDPDLWVGLGNALLIHGDGYMTPAAELAFRRAARLAPGHPGPRFFFGLALAQSGDVEQAERIWRALAADAPEDAGWRPIVERQLRLIDAARAAGQLPPLP